MKKKSIFIILLAVILTLGISPAVLASVAWSSDNEWAVIKQKKKSENRHYLAFDISDDTEECLITDLVSSNPAVASVKESDDDSITVTALKAGTTTISCKVNGTELTHDYTVCKYKNPLKSLKIGGQELKSFFKTNHLVKRSGRISGNAVQIKAAKGWSIHHVQYNPTSKSEYWGNKNGKGKASLSFKMRVGCSRGGWINIFMNNKKTKASQVINVRW